MPLTTNDAGLTREVNTLFAVGYENEIAELQQLVTVDTRPILPGEDSDIFSDIFESAEESNTSQTVTDKSIVQSSTNAVKMRVYFNLTKTPEQEFKGIGLSQLPTQIVQSGYLRMKKAIANHLISVTQGICDMKYVNPTPITSTGKIPLDVLISSLSEMLGDKLGKEEFTAIMNSKTYANIIKGQNYANYIPSVSGAVNLLATPIQGMRWMISDDIVQTGTTHNIYIIMRSGITMRGGMPDYRFFPYGSQAGLRLDKHELDSMAKYRVNKVHWKGTQELLEDRTLLSDSANWSKLAGTENKNIGVHRLQFEV